MGRVYLLDGVLSFISILLHTFLIGFCDMVSIKWGQWPVLINAVLSAATCLMLHFLFECSITFCSHAL